MSGWLLAAILAQGAAEISGVVRDSTTAEPLPYVSVMIPAQGVGTLTDDRGFYALRTLRPGRYAVVYTLIGFRSETLWVELKPGRELILNVLLSPQPIYTEEVVVTARKTAFKQETGSRITLDVRSLQVVPQLLEGDLFRTLQILPGVVMTADFSSRYSVRGGAPQENLTLLDGMVLYNPHHLMGVFSTFDLEAIRRFDFYRGGFPAAYGGALSSLVYAEMRPGDPTHFRAKGALSPLSAKLILEGPIPGGSFMVSGRRTYFDFLLPRLNPGWNLPYHFTDVLGKVQAQLTPATRVSLAGLWSGDRFYLAPGEEVPEPGIRIQWGNRGFGLTLSRIHRQLLLRGTLSYTHFSSLFSIFEALRIEDRMDLWNLRLSGTLRPSPGTDLETGLEARKMLVFFDSQLFGLRYGGEGYPWLISPFLQTKTRMGALLLSGGLRLNAYVLRDRLRPHRDVTHFQIAPRFSLRYFLNDTLALKVAWGVYLQHLVGVNFEGIFSSFSYWVPVYGRWPVMSAQHFIAGLEFLPPWGEVSLEFFAKPYGHLLTVNEDHMDPQRIDETLLRAGTGYAWGWDLWIRKDRGALQGSIAYSFVVAAGRYWWDPPADHPLPWDRRHTLNLLVSFPLLSFRWGVRFTYGSGLPYTDVVARYRFAYPPRPGHPPTPFWLEIESAPYALRFPPYHRLDLFLSRPFRLWKLRGELNLSVLNLYNRRNILLYYYDYREEPPIRRSFPMLPLLPSLEIKAEVVP